MGSKPVVTKLLQRYWRLTRSLTMGVQGVVLDDAEPRAAGAPWLPAGMAFPRRRSREGRDRGRRARARAHGGGGRGACRSAELFGVYANFQRFPGDHVVLFVARSWRQDKVPPPNAEIREQRFFAATSLPEGTTGGTRRRIAEVLGGAPRSELW